MLREHFAYVPGVLEQQVKEHMTDSAQGRDALMLVMDEFQAAGVQEMATVLPVHQLKLAERMLEINTRLAVETAFDRLRFIKKVPDGLKTDLLLMVSSCLIRLNRDQEAYNYLRHWTSPDAIADHDSSGPPKIFWNKSDYDLLESPELFYDKAPSMAFMGTVFLLKLRILQSLEIAQEWKEMMGDDMDREAIEQVRKSGSGPITKEHIQAGKLEDNANRLIHDLGQMYAFVKEGQSDFWIKLPTTHQSLEPRHDCTGLETWPMLHCYRAFADTERGLEYLRSFTEVGEKISASTH
ncbi:uncharacterized protein N0V89_008205 [Didymosphaeria variabile]|uniref:Uncharacterized protein n=1 Tax=Didymosphaeria variabile TaxID=1932322 RepID=A0A9W8XH58_9PLEO|nr:uncharacterized protein N0V89_008205 [Didymosphaeria variabile]KAJ4349589.1 hypothetical protein N0V89_008205 [Didymosphaeria variabile]